MERKVTVPQVYRINDQVLCFYLGRNVTGPSPVADIDGNWVDLDWAWGVCSYAICDGDEALIFDTNVYPDQALWIRRYLEDQRGVRRFTVVLSHWHLDHISGNEHFSDCHIIASSRCRQEMIAIKDKAEAGRLWKEPAIKVVLPDIVFEDSLSVYVGDTEVQLRRYDIHTPDSIAAFVPKYKLCLCGDMLEDTVAFVLTIEALVAQRSELERLKEMGAEVFYPDHGDPEKISNGGYGPDFIDAVLEYSHNLVELHDDPDYDKLPIERFIPKALEKRTLSVWPPYVSVHKGNVELVKAYFANKTEEEEKGE